MNTASPFQPAAEEGFTIRELSILLPPQLLKSEGLPPDYLVPLPLDSLRATFLQGRPCLRLSQIFQSCPYLFNRQLMPGEDQEVALPYQKVRRILEGAGGQPLPQAAPAQPPSRSQSPIAPSGSPFAINERAQNSPFMVANPQEAAVLKPMDNSPFQMAPGQGFPQPPAPQQPQAQPVQSPFQVASPAQQPFPGAQMPPANASPFSVQPNQASNSPFQVAQPSPMNSPFGPPGPIPGQQAPAPMPAPAQGNSPFQLASAAPAAPAPVPQGAPPPMQQSPFTVSDRLPGTERPPAIPAPGAASPFQIAPQQAGAPRPAAPAMEAPASPFKPMSEPPAQPAQQTPQAPQGQLPAMAPSGQPFSLPPMQAQPMQEAPRAAHPLPERTFSPPILKRTEPPVSGSPLPPMHQPPARPAELPRQEIAPLPPIPPAAPPVQPVAEVSNEPETVTLRLNSVLRNVAVADLGFDPANVPEAVTVQLPISLVKSQLPTGKVIVQIADIVQGVATKFRPAFARARNEMDVSLPLSELFHALPAGLIPSAPPASAAQSEPAQPTFVTPFQHVAAEDADRVAKPAAPVLPPLISPQAQDAIEGGPQSFLAGHDDLGAPRSAETLTEAPPQHLPLRGAPAAPPAPPTPVAEISLPELTKPVGYLPPLPAMPAPAPAPQPAAERPEPPAFTPPPQLPVPLPPIQRAPQAPAPVAQPAPQATSAPDPQDLQFGYQERPELLALRYLLDSPTALSPAQATQKIAELPGVAAAVLISPNGQHTGNSSDQETDVFFAKASKSHDSLKALADSIGMPPHGNFTLRADQMVRTFVLEGTICIAVLQREANLSPQVRDKLILITRELAKLHA